MKPITIGTWQTTPRIIPRKPAVVLTAPDVAKPKPIIEPAPSPRQLFRSGQTHSRITQGETSVFAGHYSAALAARAAEPRAPLWTLVAGCQLIDIGWSGLVMTGIERGRVDPALPGSPLVLDYMPFTHSLPGVIAWSLAAAFLARFLLRLAWRPAIIIGAVVFSHWLLDLFVHRPDLELFPAGPKAGFALWDQPVIEQALELGLIAVAGIFWAAERARAGLRAWPAAGFITLLVVVQIIAMLIPAQASDNVIGNGAMALAVYLLLTLAAVFLDSRPKLSRA